ASPDSIRPYVGIACLTDSRLEGYLFAIEPDQGRYSIERLTSDPLTHTTLTVGRDVESVRPGGRTNVIRGECRAGAADTALAMYVNGRLVTTTTDEHGSNAFVGMALAAGGETSRVEGWFDNALMERLNGDLETTGSPEGG
ncbi:MAG TPA: hypothetical protein VNN79_07585, partial [Actinomycetota bacterium]|nr:hypothetical protein [Actinomycetota bacterium]